MPPWMKHAGMRRRVILCFQEHGTLLIINNISTKKSSRYNQGAKLEINPLAILLMSSRLELIKMLGC
jgi:hypothetical protein